MSGGRPVSVVTGGSRGIGAAMVRGFADAGYDVLLNYLHSHDAAADVASAASSLVDIELLSANVSRRDGAQQVAERVRERFGRVDVLVNNVGSIVSPGGWRDMTEDSFRETVDTNLAATIFCSQAMIDLLVEGGSIINISSTYGVSGAGAVAAYTAAKAGVIAVTRGLARDLAPEIRVNAIVPGNIDTEMTRAAGEELVSEVIAGTPMGRLGAAEEVADLAVFLASSQARFITGESVVVDGGFSL